MPEHPQPKARPHPARATLWHDTPAPALVNTTSSVGAARYAELSVTSNFTFLTGASHPDELVTRSAELGQYAIALTDTNTLAGIVRAHVAARESGVRFLVGSRLRLRNPAGFSLLVYPTDRASYGSLCTLLTLGRRRAAKGKCHLTLHDVIAHSANLLAIVQPPRDIDDDFVQALQGLRSVFDNDRLSLAAACLFDRDHRARLNQLQALSEHTRVPLVAVNDVLYHRPERQPLHDVLACIRHGCCVENAGFRTQPNAERHLKTPDQMQRLFASHPHAIARTIDIADRALGFSLDQLRYEYPDEVVPAGSTPMRHLTELSWHGASQRYPQGTPDSVRSQILHELALIDELRYAPYFLTVHDIVLFARSRGILCQGRGAAANSAVCFCLGVTAVDPARANLLFERFISRERNEPPDIDIDFEHERREEAIQYLYAKYGRDRAALTAAIISYRGRSAVREVGKALGMSLDVVDRVARDVDWWAHDVTPRQLRALGLNADEPLVRHWVRLTREIQGFPRHLSQHVGGFVITQGKLSQSVPIENAAMADRTVIQWDKDDIDALGMLKVDVLGLGMLTCVRKCFDLVREHESVALDLASVPPDDTPTYDMICKADTVGVFQIESRAQMSMLPRLQPRCFYDLVIEVAIVRPGPIQGDMVHPYLRRRTGEEPITYPNEAVKRVLGRTLGVPLFQEQAMAMAIVAAGFTPGQADQLRRAIAAWKSKQKVIYAFGTKLIEGMVNNGYERAFAERCFEQIKGFAEYGFPESHAASFALIVYASCYLKCHHPAAFACALLNSQPMGFYAPAQIVRDVKNHGVTVRAVDVNHSDWDCTLEKDDTGAPALRLGMRLVAGLRQAEALAIVAAVRRAGPIKCLDTLHRISGVRVAALRTLARADAMNSLGMDRQAAVWKVRAMSDARSPLFEPEFSEPEFPPEVPTSLSLHDDHAAIEDVSHLPTIAPTRTVAHDYATVGLSLKAHPMSFVRDALDQKRVTVARDLYDEARCPGGRIVRVAGLVLVRQRPGTANGIVFVTLEDETGIANLILRPAIYQRYRKAARHGVAVLCKGRIERRGMVVHVLALSVQDIGPELSGHRSGSRDFH